MERSEAFGPSRGWKNKLFEADNLLAAAALTPRLAGKIDLVYIDPPFATGNDFYATSSPERAYRDTWAAGASSYLDFLRRRLLLIRGLLAPHGTLFVHCDWRLSHRIRCLLDDVFGPEAFLNEIIWRYRRWPARTRVFQRMHDSIFWYARDPSRERFFRTLYEPLAPSTRHAWGSRRQVADFSRGYRRPSQSDEESPGAPLSDVWDIGILAPIARERSGYPTQKPEALLSRILEAASRPGDLIADFFCGSGTTLVAAEKLGRRWIGCDVGRLAVHTTRKRLLDLRAGQPCQPFEVLRPGAAERRAWLRRGGDALVARLLRCHGASPAEGPLLHGKKRGAGVFIGPLDGPVTRADLRRAVAEVRRLGGAQLHVLGWQFEPGLWPRGGSLAGVAVRLFSIPGELLEDRGEEAAALSLSELPRVSARLLRSGAGRARVVLDEFFAPGPGRRGDLDALDAWAVDWNYQGDAGHPTWFAQRSRGQPALPTETPPLPLPRGAERRVLVRAFDRLGREATCLLRWKG